MSTDASNVKVLQKAFDILEIISSSNTGVSLAAIADSSGLNKSTVYRLLCTMVDRKFVERTDEGLYRIGGQMLDMVSSYIGRLELQTESKPFLYQLTNRLHLTAILAIFSERNSILIEKVEYMRVYSNYQEMGLRPPIYCTAHGKCMLACLSSSEQLYEISHLDFIPFTNNTITSVEALQAELQKIRKQGYAVDMEEHEYNQCCLAAPIYDYRGDAIAALTVNGSCLQINPDTIPTISQEVISAAKKISRRMGFYDR